MMRFDFRKIKKIKSDDLTLKFWDRNFNYIDWARWKLNKVMLKFQIFGFINLISTQAKYKFEKLVAKFKYLEFIVFISNL